MNSDDKVREDNPDGRNPSEIGVNDPAKDRKAQEKVDIKESGLGRDIGQTPADEHIEHRISQIDDDTAQMHNDNLGKPMESDSQTAEGRDAAGTTEEWKLNDGESPTTG